MATSTCTSRRGPRPKPCNLGGPCSKGRDHEAGRQAIAAQGGTPARVGPDVVSQDETGKVTDREDKLNVAPNVRQGMRDIAGLANEPSRQETFDKDKDKDG